MAKINRRLLPIKAHFFFFMAAMGPILPQLSVLGKQIGISAKTMGYITSVVPILYVLAKPMFGFVADYFSSMRKLIFMMLITTMTLAYLGFYFVPGTQPHEIPIDVTQSMWDIRLSIDKLQPCSDNLLAKDALCRLTREVTCVSNASNVDSRFIGLVTKTNSSTNSHLNVTSDLYNICLLPNQMLSSNDAHFNGNCTIDVASHCIYRTPAFWIFVCALFIGTIGFNVTNSISDAICFDMLGETEEHKYGVQRVWGTVGFGLTALLSGILVEKWTTIDMVNSFTPALILMCFFSGLDLISVSRLRLPQLSSSESIWKDVCTLISHPSIMVFLVFATIAGIMDSFIIYFMFWHVEDVAEQTGFKDQIKFIEGLVVAAECLAGEVPFFFYSGKIIKKLGYIHCMSLCFFFYAVRLALISWIPNPWYLVAVELFFQGATYALCYTCIVAYASAVAPPGTSATVQGLMAGMDDGLGFSIGSFIGGLMIESYGGRRSFMYFAIAALCTCIAHVIIRPTSRKRQYLPKTGYQVPVEQGEELQSMPKQ